MTQESRDRLSGAQTVRTEARLAANHLTIEWLREFHAWLGERIPAWEAQQTESNRVYTAVLNTADMRIIDLVTAIVAIEQVQRADGDEALLTQLTALREEVRRVMQERAV
jgi:hypothetical protein